MKQVPSTLRKIFNVLNFPFVAKRMRQLEAMPLMDLQSFHTEGTKVLPNRLALLEQLPQQAVVAEIGVADGDFSSEILKRCHPARLHLIDLWQSDRYRDGKHKVELRFKSEINSGQVVLNRGFSTSALKIFADNTFDWVYIDTDHTYLTTAQELLLAERIVKPGGQILGHDFCTASAGRGVVYGVVQAVNEFCVKRTWCFDYIALDPSGHFSFCLSRPR